MLTLLKTRFTVQPRALWVAILIAAVGLRLAVIIVFSGTFNTRLSGYEDYADHLLAGQGYTRFADLHPDSDLPPLYSFFLAGVYGLFGHNGVAVALIQTGFDAVTIAALYGIGRRVGGEWTGLLAAAFFAFYPYLLFQDLSTNDTAIFIMLVAVAIWAIYRAEGKRAWAWVGCAGLLLGLAALTKTLVVLLLPLIALWWWRHKGLRTAVGFSLVLTLGFIAFPTPWIIRNTRLHGAFTLISTNDGSNLYQGNNPCTADYLLNGWDAQWTIVASCMTPVPKGLYFERMLPELQEEAWYRNQALVYLRTHVEDWPKLFGAKLLNLWSPELMPRGVPTDIAASVMNDQAVLQFETPAFQIARIVHLIYFTPLLILALIGLWRAWHDRLLIGPVIALPIAITIAYLIYHPSTRYRSPADPFVFILSAYGLLWLWQLWQTRRTQSGQPG